MSGTPYLVTGPAAMPVSLADMKAHLRVDHDDEDDEIAALQASAVAHLDGIGGVLGRCIMEQTWAQDFEQWGNFRIAMPDASNVTVTYLPTGEESHVSYTAFLVKRDGQGFYVKPTGVMPSADEIKVQYTCEMSAERLPAAQALVKLLVGHWYENREAAGQKVDATPLAVDALVGALRWQSL